MSRSASVVCFLIPLFSLSYSRDDAEQKTLWVEDHRNGAFFNDGGPFARLLNSSSTETVAASVVSGHTLVTNTAKIDSLWFDPGRNTININYTFTPLPGVDLDLGITYDPLRHRVTNNVPTHTSGRIVSLAQPSGTVSIDLSTSILFDTLYYVGLWLKALDGEWLPPNPAVCSCLDSVRTTAPHLQQIRYFDPERRPDTVRALNNQVWVWCDERYRFPDWITDTVRVHTPGKLPAATTVLSPGFTFAEVAPSPIFVGVQYDSRKIPAGYGHADVCLYRDSAGVLLAVHGAGRDSTRGLVWTYATDIGRDQANYPFIALVDMQRPSITVASDTVRALDPEDAPPVDTIIISDNISNVRWQLLSARDGDTLSLSAKGYTSSAAPVIVPLPSGAISSDNGIRALLVISDGAHVDTINISRRARRARSDLLNTVEMEYVPLCPTAVLDTPDVAHALRALSQEGKPWSYDNTAFRLMYWSHTSGKSVHDRWVEYTPANADEFRFIPGSVFWIKTRRPQLIDFGSGTTVSQKQPFEIVLSGGEWSHFSIPYRYDIMLKDILESSGTGSDSLELYSWNIEESTDRDYKGKNRYISGPIYIQELIDLAKADTTVGGGDLRAYAAFNPTNTDIRLRIPSLPVSMSQLKKSPARSTAMTWNIRVDVSTGSGPLTPIYCGYFPGNGHLRYFNRLPSFNPVVAGVYDRSGSTIKGHAVRYRAENGGFAYEIAFRNAGSESQDVTFRLNRLETLPYGLGATIVDPLSPSTSQCGDHTLTLAAGETTYRWLVVGDAGFRQGFTTTIPSKSLLFLGCSPNPFRGQTTIRYSVPYSGVTAVRFSLCDVQGRPVWRETVHPSGSGEQSTYIDLLKKRPPAGVYIMRMTAVNGSGKTVGTFKQRVTVLP